MTDHQPQGEDQETIYVWGFRQPWRQGSVLPRDCALALDLFSERQTKQFAIVATHDCDCVMSEDEEPNLELILGREIEEEEYNGNFTLAKSTRKLHIYIDQYEKYIELSSISRTSIDKLKLLDVTPSSEWRLDRDQLRVFRRWLAARYERVSFPEELVRRLKPVVNHFKKASKKDGDSIIGIYVRFEPEGELAHDSLEPYAFNIDVVYDSTKVSAAAAAGRIAKSLQEKFVSEYKSLHAITGDQWANIELESSMARSDIDFTLKEALSSYVFRLDDVSLKMGSHGTIPPQ